MDLRLSDSTKIHWVLDTIVSHQLPVSIEFAEFELTCKCKIISVDAVSGYMTIGQISSSESLQRLTENQRFSLSANVNGVRIGLFELSARPMISRHEIEYFNVKIPQYVYYAQRRDVFRAQVGGYMEVPVSVHAANTFPSADVPAMTQGHLANISVEGCAVSISGSCSIEMREYKLLTVLKLVLPYEAFFPPVFAKLRHCRPDATQGFTMLGFSFFENDKITQRELGMLATRMQLLARESTELSA